MKAKFFSLTAVIIFTAIVSAFATSPGNEPPVVKTTTKGYAMELSNNPGIFCFDIKTPNKPEMYFPLEDNEIASAGTYANGKYYTMILNKEQKPLGIYTYNLKTGDRSLLRDMSDATSFFLDMTYDYTTSTLYAIWENWPNTTLIKVNTENGEPTLIKDIPNASIYAIAASPEGILYAMSSRGDLYTVDKNDGTLTELFQTQNYTENFQSMDFDHNSGRLYWTYQTWSGKFFNEVDLEKKEVRMINSFPGNYLVGGLYMAFTDAVPESPKTIDDLKIKVNESLAPVLSWTNPSKTLDNKDLNNLSYAEIYRNDTLVHKLTGITKGSSSEWTDTSAPNQTNKYKVITYTSDNNESIPAWISIFAGRDVPAAPNNVVATKLSTTSASISWEAPTTGLNNSWFDKESLAYKVIRKPDNTTLINGTKETSYTDKNVTSFSNYSYQIIAISTDGEGGSAISNSVALGESIQMPFSSPLDTEDDFNLWTVFNRDEKEESWKFGRTDYSKEGAESWTDRTNYTPTNNWLVSPPLALEKGKIYELSFKANTAYYETERLRITLGKEIEPEAQTIIVQDLEIKSYYGTVLYVTLPVLEESGKYYLGLQHTSVSNQGMVLHINDVLLKEQDKGEVAGIVTDGTNPLANVTLTLSGQETFTTQSDTEGKYSFTDIIAGEYNLKATLLGYEEKETKITVTPLKTTESNITITTLPQYSVNGKITDNGNTPVRGAWVTINGYNNYKTSTNENGEYTFEKVYKSDNYQLTVRKNNFEVISNQPLQVQDNVSNEVIKLTYKNIPPYSVTTEESNTGNQTINWERPFDTVEYLYDNGTPKGPLGYNEGSEYHILGNIFRTPTTIHRVKWFTNSSEGKKPYVHVYIIDLDENGMPTGTLLFSQKNVPTNDDVWTTFELPERVNAPRGFMLALSSDGNVYLANDNNSDVIGKQIQCFSTDYRYPNDYTYFDARNWEGALMLRAEGEMIEASEHPLNVTYDVWRMTEKEQSTPEKWTKIKAGTTELATVDETFADLPKDTYKYAVKANYPVDKLTSDAIISAPIYHKQFTNITMNVTTNSVPKDAEGASVNIDDNKGNKYQTTVSNGKATFQKIWKGNYTLTLTQPGFEKQVTNLNVTENDQYEFSYTLIQKKAPVSNIDIMATDKPAEWQLLWNLFANIEDGFEDSSYEDFELNPVGNTGWQYVDNDRYPTYGFGATTFPNMREPMAAIIFNSNTTEPPLGINTAHSGQRALGFFASRETEDENEQIIMHDSDDYLISPKLNFHKDFTFSFFARSYDSENGLERIRVGYSTTDAQLSSFTYLDEEFINVPTEYTEYSYSIPKEAKYVILNSHSRSSFLLLVDDVFIGTDKNFITNPEEGNGSFKTYKVYLDNKLITETQDSKYLLTGLSSGKHTAAVTKVYNSGESNPISIDFTVIGGDNIDYVNDGNLIVYLTPENKLVINGDYKLMNLYSMAGTPIMSSENQPEIDLNRLSKGVYMVYITTLDNRQSIHKIIIK